MFGIPPDILLEVINSFNSYFISNTDFLGEMTKQVYSLPSVLGKDISEILPTFIFGNFISYVGQILYTKAPRKCKIIAKFLGGKDEISFEKIDSILSNKNTFQRLYNVFSEDIEKRDPFTLIELFKNEFKDLNLSKAEIMECFSIIIDLFSNEQLVKKIDLLYRQIAENLTQNLGSEIAKTEMNIIRISTSMIQKLEESIKKGILDIQETLKKDKIFDTKFKIFEHENTKLRGLRSCWINGKIEQGEINFCYDAKRPILHSISQSIEDYFGTLILSKPYFGKSTILKRIIYEKYTLEGYFVVFTDEVFENSAKIENVIETLISEYPKILIVIDDAHQKGIEAILRIYDQYLMKFNSNLLSSVLKFLFSARTEEFTHLKFHLNLTEMKYYDSFMDLPSTNKIEIDFSDSDGLLFFRKGFEVTFPELTSNSSSQHELNKIALDYVKRSKENNSVNPLILICNLRHFLTFVQKNLKDNKCFNHVGITEIEVFSKCLENHFTDKQKRLDDFNPEEKRATILCTLMNCFNISFSLEILKKCNVYTDITEKLYQNNFIEKTSGNYQWIHELLAQEFLIFLYRQFLFDFESFNNRYNLKEIISCILNNISYFEMVNVLTRCVVMYQNNEYAHHIAKIIVENFNIPTSLSQNDKANLHCFGLGGFYMEIRDYSKAREHFNKAILIDKKHIPSHINLGIALAELNQFDQSIAECDFVISNSKEVIDLSDSFTNKGQVFVRMGKVSEAIDEFDKAIAIDSTHYKSRYDKGTLLFQLEKYQEAIYEFDKAIAINPYNPECFNNKGACLVRMNRYQEAIDEFDKALMVDLENLDANFNKGKTMLTINKYQDAINEFEKAESLLNKELWKRNPTKRSEIGSKIDLDSFSADDVIFTKLLDTFYEKGITLFQLEKYQEAIDEFDKVLKFDKLFVNIHYFKGKSLFELNRYQEAIDEFDKDLSFKPTAEVFFLSGVALFQLEKYQEAIDEFDKAKEIEPQLDLDTYYRSICFFNLNKYQEAIDEYDKLISSYHDEIMLYINKGKALFQLEKYQEAIDEFDNALAIDPKNSESIKYKDLSFSRLRK